MVSKTPPCPLAHVNTASSRRETTFTVLSSSPTKTTGSILPMDNTICASSVLSNLCTLKCVCTFESFEIVRVGGGKHRDRQSVASFMRWTTGDCLLCVFQHGICNHRHAFVLVDELCFRVFL